MAKQNQRLTPKWLLATCKVDELVLLAKVGLVVVGVIEEPSVWVAAWNRLVADKPEDDG